MVTKKICCIIPYFGKFGNFFNLWMESCERNSNIDFLLISDNDQPQDLPENFKYLHSSFGEFRNRIQSLFPFAITLDTPYKLCDFKPAYGELLKNELKQYDFWGYIDCDLILGKIDDFLDDGILEEYDKIYSHGHFTLFRNSNKINSIYRRMNIKEVFQTNYCCHFDEWGGISRYYKENGLKQYDAYDMADINATKYRFVHASPFGKYPQIFEYGNGRLWCCYVDDAGKCQKEERLYIHLQKRKMDIQLPDHMRQHYLIIPNQFISYDNATVDGLLAKQHKRVIYWHWYRVRLEQIVTNLKNGALQRRIRRIRIGRIRNNIDSNL